MLVLAVGLGLVGIALSLRPEPPHIEATTQVLSAKKDIPPGTIIEPAKIDEYFDTKTLPVSQAQNALIYSDTLRSGVIALRDIRAGETISQRSASPVDQARLGVSDLGLEIVSFPARFDEMVGGQVKPGSRINIYGYRPGENQTSPEVRLVATNVWVVDVRAASGEAAGRPSPTPVPQNDSLLPSSINPNREAPASIVTVATQPEVVWKIVDTMGAQRFSAWVSLSGSRAYQPAPTATPVQPTATAVPQQPTPVVRATLAPPPAPAAPAATPTAVAISNPAGCNWSLSADTGYLIGGYPDNFDYGGEKSSKVSGGQALVSVDTCRDFGLVSASFKGTIRPEAGKVITGNVRINLRDFKGSADYQQNGIASNVTLLGDSGKDVPYLPKVQAQVAGWGKGDVYVDDRLVYESLDAEFMYSDGTRNDKLQVLKADNSCCFDYKKPADGKSFLSARELQIWVYSNDTDSANFPTKRVWLSLMYRPVVVVIAPPNAPSVTTKLPTTGGEEPDGTSMGGDSGTRSGPQDPK